jgi:hypothetical protein
VDGRYSTQKWFMAGDAGLAQPMYILEGSATDLHTDGANREWLPQLPEGVGPAGARGNMRSRLDMCLPLPPLLTCCSAMVQRRQCQQASEQHGAAVSHLYHVCLLLLLLQTCCSPCAAAACSWPEQDAGLLHGAAVRHVCNATHIFCCCCSQHAVPPVLLLSAGVASRAQACTTVL